MGDAEGCFCVWKVSEVEVTYIKLEEFQCNGTRMLKVSHCLLRVIFKLSHCLSTYILLTLVNSLL